MSKSKVKVCIATRTYFPVYAGPAIRFKNYLPGFKSRSIDPIIMTDQITEYSMNRDGSISTVKNYTENTRQEVNMEKIDGIPVYRLNGNGNFTNKFVKYILEKKPEIDLVHFLSLEQSAIPWLIRLRKNNIKTIFTNTLLSPLSKNKLRAFIQKRWRGSYYNYLDRVVVSSTAMKKDLLSLKIKTPIDIIPNGVNLSKFKPLDNSDQKIDIRKKLGLPTNKRIILSVGPICPRKRSDHLITSYSEIHNKFPDSYLVMVGSRHDINRPELKEFHNNIFSILKEKNAEEKVLFTGLVENVDEYMQAADLFVFTSSREGMPNVIPEAMATGLAVITTPFLGLPDEFGAPGHEYLLTDWSVSKLAKDMSNLLTDDMKLNQLADTGCQWVRKKLNVEKSLDSYASLYRSIKNNE
ncbi:glycosyltransferase family 4 protein [candidate division KSB1 bacterium]|nr:glycosyltransferase family 4 protein [candidate division KSB1 bacterium]